MVSRHLIGYDHELDEDYQAMRETSEMYILDRIDEVDMKLGGGTRIGDICLIQYFVKLPTKRNK